MNATTTAEIETERVSLVDTAWLHMDAPTNLMMVGSLSVFDAPLDHDLLMTTLEQRLLVHPRFREHIQQSLVGPPSWALDPLFDLGAHVHRISLPAPGGDAELRVFIGDQMSSPLDMSRPLWDAHIIENYRGGSVLLTRIHHSIGDGTALVRVLLGLTEPTAAASLEPPHRARAAKHPGGHFGLEHLDPRHAVHDVAQLGAHLYTLARLTTLWPDPGTSLRGDLVRSKRVAWTAPFPLDALRPLRAESGYTLNDILVAAVSGALRTHLRKGGGPVPPSIRAMVPVDMRPAADDGGELGNQFGLVFLDMPVGLARQRDRLEAVHAAMDTARHSAQPAVAFEILGALGAVPRALQRQALRFFGTKGTAVVTNVRGPAEHLYMAGRRLSNLVFFVPQTAMLGIGVSIMTYAGNIQVGVIADAGLVPAPGEIALDVTRELRRFAKS